MLNLFNSIQTLFYTNSFYTKSLYFLPLAEQLMLQLVNAICLIQYNTIQYSFIIQNLSYNFIFQFYSTILYYNLTDLYPLQSNRTNSNTNTVYFNPLQINKSNSIYSINSIQFNLFNSIQSNQFKYNTPLQRNSYYTPCRSKKTYSNQCNSIN